MCICLWVCAWTLQVFPARTRRGHWVPCGGIKGGVGCQMCSEPNPGPLKNNTGFPLLSYLWSCRQCSCFRDGWLIYHKVIFCMCFEVFQQRKWRTQYTEYSESKQWEFLCFKISKKKKKKTFQKSIFFWEKLLLQSPGWLLPSGPQVPRPWDNRQASAHRICKCSLSCFCDFSDNQETQSKVIQIIYFLRLPRLHACFYSEKTTLCLPATVMFKDTNPTILLST